MDKERQENYEQARNKMGKYIGQSLSHAIVQEIHAAVMGSMKAIGYRDGFGSPPILNARTGEKRYSPPCSGVYSIDRLMQELFYWHNESSSVIKKAAQLHWGIVKIHPFDDGNGRTARLLVLFVLRSSGYDDLTCSRLEEYFEMNRCEYDNSLNDGIKSYKGFKEVGRQFIDFVQAGLN